MASSDCSLLDWQCNAGNWVESVLGDAIENLARAVIEAFGKAVASVGTLWVNVGTPNLTGTGGGSAITVGQAAPNSDGIVQVLGWVTWIAIVLAAISIILLGALVATRMRAGEGFRAVGPLGFVLSGIFLMSGATALVSGLLPRGPQGAGGAVLFLQSSLWWYMGAAAVVSVIIGGIRMGWEQRAEPGKETIESLLTLIVVAGSGVTLVGLLVSAFDSFSVWILNGSLSCDVGADSACFGENIVNLLALTSNPNAGGLGSLLIIILGIIAILATAAQIVLMIARGGMLVILTGILPLSASATNTEMGKNWFKKNVGWLVAFILYKPAAAIVYAAAFQLVGTNIFQDDGTGFIAVLTGLILMVLALFAMPALMRFVTPLVSSLSAGAGGALGAAAIMALPSGAAAAGRLATGSGGGSSSAGGPGATGGQGSTGASGPSGSNGGGGSAPQAAQASSAAGGGGGGTTGAAASSGAAGGGTGAAAASAGGGAAAGGSAAAGGGAAGGGAAGGAAVGSAGGPVGMAAGVAIGAAAQGAQAATGAAKNVGDQATGEGSGS
ncbi:hypothetical protein RWH43_17105 [Microbacterium sp. KSW2-21]|uniref:Epstein-Barr nuclear antigen 1 (EBV nuclear antigen 1) (EBNA-1) n=1 Tax=Microbacterium algihabitans TaxID=3075992 RepID=A0ABU3S0A2_9MICO|nr:hypothetical protein [Microbacterium sp. KSW2-21]MDU0328480.1 hypothetical protein [Microbacterium sp. KSW2-21]